MERVLPLAFPLLPQRVHATKFLGASLIGVEQHVVAAGIGGKKSIHPSGLQRLVSHNFFEHRRRVGEQLRGFCADHRIGEDSGILPAQLPSHEERGPVDIGNERLQRHVGQLADTEELGRVDRRRRPIGGPAFLAGHLEGHERRLLAAFEVFHIALLGEPVFPAEFLARGGVDQFFDHTGRPRGVEHMDDVA